MTSEQWECALRDAGVGGGATGLVAQLVEHLAAVLDAGQVNNATRLRRAASSLATHAVAVASDLWCLAALRPGALAEPLRDRVIEAALASLDAEANCAAMAVDALAAPVKEAFGRLERSTEGVVEDPLEALFGARRPELTDVRGVFAQTRVLAMYYGRPDELTAIVNELLSPLTSTPPNTIDGLRAASALFLSPRPVLSLRTAVAVQALILEKVREEPRAAATPLRDLKLRVDRSAANHASMLRVNSQLAQATTEADRAVLRLELYRKMVEGQLRPWAWTILRLRGRSLNRMPELSTLRDQLQADGHRLCTDAARAVLPAARNAAAHEDFEWDSGRRSLLVGNATVTVDELAEATERAYAFMAGAECGWACARAESPLLAHLLDADLPPQSGKVIDLDGAVERFGTNGLRVKSWTYEDGVLRVVVDEVPFRLIDPCFQAVLEAWNRLKRPDRVVVLMDGRDDPVVDLRSAALAAASEVWWKAVRLFRPLPLCTFLPANVATRLAAEPPVAAAEAAAWLALNDAAHAYNEAYDSPNDYDHFQRLLRRLDLVRDAIARASAVLPALATHPLLRADQLVTNAMTALDVLDQRLVDGTERAIRSQLDDWPTPSIMPTADARPLDVVMAEADVDAR